MNEYSHEHLIPEQVANLSHYCHHASRAFLWFGHEISPANYYLQDFGAVRVAYKVTSPSGRVIASDVETLGQAKRICLRNHLRQRVAEFNEFA